MTRFSHLILGSTAIVTVLLTISACSYVRSPAYHPEQPARQAIADDDMQAVLDAQASLKPKPIETLTARQARLQPTPTDGVKKILIAKGKNPNDPMGILSKNITIDGAAGHIPARVYWPKNTKADEKLPVIVYYHGGGWVIADINTYDATPRALAKQVNAIVVSVEYRHAPEHKFPAAHDDAFTAYRWTLKNIGRYNGDAKRVAVVGESAGGNLAINTAIKARDTGVQLPLYQALIYPVAGINMNTESYVENANAKPLNKAMMGWFMKNTIRAETDKLDARLDLIRHANLRGLPPATIITAQIDPLRTDGELLAAKLKQSGVPVHYETYEGVTHEFFGMAAVVSDAADAQSEVAGDLKKALR